MKVFCEKCKEFVDHDFRRWPFCDRCRKRVPRWGIILFVVVPILLFIIKTWSIYAR